MIGIILRLIFMPLTFHADMNFTYMWADFLGKGVWDIYGFQGADSIIETGVTYYAPAVYFIIGAYQAVFHVASPLWMKFPYLVADLLCLRVLWTIKKNSYALWLYSPVVIFSTYIFGSWRVISALVALLVILSMKKDKKVLASVLLGVLCLMENYAFILLLPAAISMGKRVKHLSIMLGTFLTVFIPLYIHSKGAVVYAYISPRHLEAFNNAITNSFFPEQVALVSKLLFALIFVLVCSNKKLNFVKASACLLLSFHALFQCNAHYFMWVMPFLVLIMADGEPWPRLITWCVTGLLFLFTLDQRALNLGLFSPVLKNAMSYPSFNEVMSHYFPWGKVVALSRLTFSGVCLYMAYRLGRREYVCN